MSLKNWIFKLFGKAGESSEKVSVQSQTQEEKTELKKIPVESVSLPVRQVELYVGQSFQLPAVVLPCNATDVSLAWSSSDSSVAVVDGKGVVKALKAGRATIIALSKDGPKSAPVTVVVSSIVLRGELKDPVNGDKFADLPDVIEMNRSWAGGTSLSIYPFKQDGSELTQLSSHEVRLTVLPGKDVHAQIHGDIDGATYVRIRWARYQEGVTIQVMDPGSQTVIYSRTLFLKV